MLTNQKTNKGGIMTFEEHFNNLIDTLNKRFPKLVKKHNLNVVHSGGGCFHIDFILNKKLSVSINPYSKDVEYDIPKSEKSKCIFGIYDEEGNQTNTFFKSFKDGLKRLEEIKRDNLKGE